MPDAAQPLALIVESEALLALMVEDLLTAEGFDTAIAADEQQVSALTSVLPPLAVAVVDLRLGGSLAGRQIIRTLRERVPDLPVVVVTGYDADVPEADLRGLGWPTVRLFKPYCYDELASAVWDIMDQARTGRRSAGGCRAAE